MTPSAFPGIDKLIEGLATSELRSNLLHWFPSSKAMALDGFGPWAQAKMEDFL